MEFVALPCGNATCSSVLTLDRPCLATECSGVSLRFRSSTFQGLPLDLWYGNRRYLLSAGGAYGSSPMYSRPSSYGGSYGSGGYGSTYGGGLGSSYGGAYGSGYGSSYGSGYGGYGSSYGGGGSMRGGIYGGGGYGGMGGYGAGGMMGPYGGAGGGMYGGGVMGPGAAVIWMST